MADQSASLEWRDGIVPISKQYDDPYFSLEDGLAETRHVFLEASDIPARLHDGFHIAELGFGSGLNLLATWLAWRQKGAIGTLRFTSFEAHPLKIGDMQRALANFAELEPLVDEFVDGYNGAGHMSFWPDLHLQIIHGDARETVPSWAQSVDAWYLDGFSPAKNPQLWDEGLLSSVGDCTKFGGTFATYTAAGFVRRNLESAGFEVFKPAGFGRKRHMLCGKKGMKRDQG